VNKEGHASLNSSNKEKKKEENKNKIQKKDN